MSMSAHTAVTSHCCIHCNPAGLTVGFLLVGGPGSLMPRAWCLRTPGPSWRVHTGDAPLLVPQLRPPRPLATSGVSGDTLLLQPPCCDSLGAAATLLQAVCCSLHAALTALQSTLVYSLLHTAVAPSPVTNPGTIGAPQPKCSSLMAALFMLFMLQMDQLHSLQLYPSPVTNRRTIWALRPKCSSLVAALFMMQSVLQSL